MRCTRGRRGYLKKNDRWIPQKCQYKNLANILKSVLQSEEYLVCDTKSLLLQLQGLVMTLCKVPWKFHLYLTNCIASASWY